jgi:hypothetical protein
MKPKRNAKISRQDLAWQNKVDKKLKSEIVVLNHPKGQERFEQVVKHSLRKKNETN